MGHDWPHVLLPGLRIADRLAIGSQKHPMQQVGVQKIPFTRKESSIMRAHVISAL